MVRKLRLFPAKRKSTALVLGGGGARGLAHLGLIRYLEQKKYCFDFIVGTSAGAIFGAHYLLSESAEQAYQNFVRVIKILKQEGKLLDLTAKQSPFLSNLKEKLYLAKALFTLSVLGEDGLKGFIRELVSDSAKFNQLKKPLYVVATDLLTGRDVVFSKGNLATPLLASSSIPGAFPPVRYKKYRLIDGGTTQKLPVGIAGLLGADQVLGVDVGSKFKKKTKFTTAPQVIIRSEEISSRMLHQQNRQAADLLIEPEFINFNWYDFDRHKEAYDAGYIEALRNKEEIDNFFQGLTVPRKKSSRHTPEVSDSLLIID